MVTCTACAVGNKQTLNSVSKSEHLDGSMPRVRWGLGCFHPPECYRRFLFFVFFFPMKCLFEAISKPYIPAPDRVFGKKDSSPRDTESGKFWCPQFSTATPFVVETPSLRKICTTQNTLKAHFFQNCVQWNYSRIDNLSEKIWSGLFMCFEEHYLNCRNA